MSIKQNNYKKHSFFMGLALNQAHKNLGNTGLNPSVGCIIVKDESLLSVGNTSINGRPHAETNAIKFSKYKLKNSSLYVTLEPCSHYGKTAPCVSSIINSKIKKVFFSINDPDPRSFNKSMRRLKKKSISVKSNVLSSKVKRIYKSYYKSKNSSIPYVTAKIAISKDHFTKDVQNKWITNKFSRGRVHLMRANYDCIISSAKTINSDNPKYTCRILGLEFKSPDVIIIDKDLSIKKKSYLLSNMNKSKIVIFYNKNNIKKLKLLKKLKIRLIKTPLTTSGYFDLKEILKKIKLLGFHRIFLESGLKLTTNFLNNNLIDDFKLFISGKKIGKNGVYSFKNNMNDFFKGEKLIQENVNLFGDRLISYRIK